ncbi:MAG: hypothetical protein R2769_16580 [Saprospiraceae bacterium]
MVLTDVLISNKSSSLSAFYVEVLGGMDKSFKSITPKNPNSDLDAYINSKDSTESDWYTFSSRRMPGCVMKVDSHPEPDCNTAKSTRNLPTKTSLKPDHYCGDKRCEW